MENPILNYRVIGEGHPVVFLHGFLENSTMWDEIIPHFTYRKVITIDLFGHGNSPDFSEEQLTLEIVAKEVLHILRYEKITSYSIIGHSLGGYVALSLLKLNPTNVNCQHLILLNSHPWEDSPTKKNERSQVAAVVSKNKSLFLKTAIPNLFRTASLFPRQVKQLISDAEKMTEKAIIDMTLAMRNRPDYVELLENNEDKIYVMQGKYDNLISFEKMRTFTTSLDISYFEISEVGHMAHIEDPQTVVRMLLGILG